MPICFSLLHATLQNREERSASITNLNCSVELLNVNATVLNRFNAVGDFKQLPRGFFRVGITGQRGRMMFRRHDAHQSATRLRKQIILLVGFGT
jgi:hypothetical protein